MSRNKFYLGVLVSVILAVIGYVSYGMLNAGKERESYTISVIVENSSSDRWNAFKEGLDQGAEGKNVYLNVVSTVKFSSFKEECMIIRRELENGADGVIVEGCSSFDQNDLFYDITSEKPVVLVGNDIESKILYSEVMPDHYELGAAIARSVIDGEQSVPGDYTIGVIGQSISKKSMKQRLEGFEDSISETGGKITWSILEDLPKSRTLLERYMEKSPVDILVSLDNDETELAVDYLLDERVSCRLYGEGRSEKTVYYLDKGLIQALVVPNEYYMGYESMEIMMEKLEQYTTEIRNEEVDFLSVTKERMYDEDVGKILFPVVR